MNVAFIIFNRPDLTARVFTEIARAKPHKLFVIADGPRPAWPGDAEKCTAARAILERVDWDCEVFQNYAAGNLGCGQRVSTGLRWVFEHVEEAIILEDDCFPHPSFFPFCQELLAQYRDEEQIMMISGSGLYDGPPSPYSFSFSKWGNIWGWASWRRAWHYHDMAMPRWPALRATRWLQEILQHPRAVHHFRQIFDATAAGAIDTWDYQWMFACWLHGLSIRPNVTLVSNLGFRDDVTHTKSPTDVRANRPLRPMAFPLRYPPRVAWDRQTEQWFITHRLVPTLPPEPGWLWRVYRQGVSLLPHPLRRGLSWLKHTWRRGPAGILTSLRA